MKKIFLLLKENIPLAKEEVLTLTNSKEYEIIDNLLILETDFSDYARLAYTRAVYELLFIAYKDNLTEKMQEYDWQSIYKKDFCLRISNSDLNERELAGYIWRKLKNPKTNLTDSETQICIFKQKSKFLCAKLIKEINNDFESRRGNKRPASHPTTIHPRLARAIINLTGIPLKKTLLDPFCGSGGILIEAGLMKIKTIGYDIDEDILEKAKINLKHYKIKNIILKKIDSLTISKAYEYIIADFPYGINTSPKNLEQLYINFMKLLEKILKKRAVLTFPHFINYKKLLNQTSLKIKSEFTHYLHKNLSKKIIVVEP